jgi:hypothetical protein
MTLDDIDVRRLACAVLQTALTDATWTRRAGRLPTHHRCAEQHRATARAFLNSAVLDVWAHWAGVSAGAIRDAVRRGLVDRPARRVIRYPS